jgi:hypothetical protein
MILSVVARMIGRNAPAVIVIELRRQPNGVEGPASVCIIKNAEGIFHKEPEWIRNEGWS